MTYVKSLFVACLVGAAFTATPAFGWDKKNQPVTTTVDIRDLQTDSGIAKIHDQLTRKAQRSCQQDGPQSAKLRQSAEICAQEMLGKFVEDLDHEKLTSYHARVTQKA